MARRPPLNSREIRAPEMERQRALEFLRSINPAVPAVPAAPAVATRNTLYDQLTARNMLHCYQAMIHIMFGYQIGLDLERHNEETFWKMLCLVFGIVILYLFSHSAFFVPMMPNLVSFTRRRSLPAYILMVTVALLYYILKMMNDSYKMQADYIALHLCLNNLLLVGLLQPINADGGFASTQCYIWSTLVIFYSQTIFRAINDAVSGAKKAIVSRFRRQARN